MWFSMALKTQKLLIAADYRPSSSNCDIITYLKTNTLSRLTDFNAQSAILLGDFNVHHKDWLGSRTTDTAGRRMLELSSSLGLKIVTDPGPGAHRYQWKCASVIPIHKRYSNSNPAKYRPISLLSNISKVMEAAVQAQLQKYLLQNQLISSDRQGYDVRLIALDIEGAFDKVWHNGLCSNLKSSILLFSVFIDDLGDECENPLYLYADDSTLHCVIRTTNDSSTTTASLNRDLERMRCCADTWKLEQVRGLELVSLKLNAKGRATVYKAQVRSIMEYASLCWMSALTTSRRLLDSIQRQAFCIIGVNKQQARLEPDIPSLHHRRQIYNSTNFEAMELRKTDERRLRSSSRGTPSPTASVEGRRARPSQEQGNDRKRMKTDALGEVVHAVVTEMRAEWRELGHNLGLSHVDIEATDRKHRGNPTECCREVLELWRRGSGSQATLEKLGKALRKARRVDLAEGIERRGTGSGVQIPGTPDHAPRNVKVVFTTESWIKIAWTPPATCVDAMLIGYKVEFCLARTDEWLKAHELHCLPPNTTEFKVGGLTKRNQYQFRVSSLYRGRMSEPSYSDFGIAKKQGQPLPPRNPRVTDRDIEKGTVSLEWLEPEDDGGSPITLYIVDKCLRSKWEKCLETSELQCTLNDVKSGWRLRVSAKNNKGHQSDPSEMVDPEIRMRVEVKEAGQESEEAAQNTLWKSAFNPQGLSGKKIEDGSIVFVYSCDDPIGLCNLWMMYCQGEVCQYFQKQLVTIPDVKLGVTIDQEDFRASCNHLLLTRPTKHGYRVLSDSINTDLFCLVNHLASTRGNTTSPTQGKTIGHVLSDTSKTSRSSLKRAKKHLPSIVAPGTVLF
ncbi:MYOM3 [Branchiostoma lanceolatum]|uniref:MYOM3 protein n=1 Tax=Branchiostoma lanceolatum TaxID=7740 RepID=A0A8K0EE92_BRALA|nr:MYOM3 [Branchiostoma lanceolatum]